MKTKVLIKSTALSLFNQKGVMNVTLRDVAAALQKSYGNITYHYAGKEALLQELYLDMQQALKQIGEQFTKQEQLLYDIIRAPKTTYLLSLQYRFFYSDYLELQRHYPVLMQQVQQQQQLSLQFYKERLMQLQKMGLVRNDLPPGSLDTLMLLSGLVRTFFFIQSPTTAAPSLAEAERYFLQVNQVLWPYLTPAGTAAYQKYIEQEAPSIV